MRWLKSLISKLRLELSRFGPRLFGRKVTMYRPFCTVHAHDVIVCCQPGLPHNYKFSWLSQQWNSTTVITLQKLWLIHFLVQFYSIKYWNIFVNSHICIMYIIIGVFGKPKTDIMEKLKWKHQPIFCVSFQKRIKMKLCT